MHDNLVQFLRQRQETFPFRREIDLRHFLEGAIGLPAVERLPVPAKIFPADDDAPMTYGFPLAKSSALDELESRFQRWVNVARDGSSTRADDLLSQYREHVAALARNAHESSILADYHSVFWLVHSQQLSRVFARIAHEIFEAGATREDSERTKYGLYETWAASLRSSLEPTGFLELLLENPILAADEHAGPDLREIRGYFAHAQGDYFAFRRSFDDLRAQIHELATHDRLFRRALTLLGYAETRVPAIATLDPRVRHLLGDHPSFRPVQSPTLIDAMSRRALELFVVQTLRGAIVWMQTEDDSKRVYSRAVRPLNFGRRGVVEPIVYRFGLVYDINSFTETLGRIAHGGQAEENLAYRQMLGFQRDLAAITERHGLQFEKFLGDGAFYTSRRPLRTLEAAVDMQRFYAAARADGFAFDKGMRIALNYGYYRLLPMQVSTDGAHIVEFYGPGIVELSRLTTGKATRELEDTQHLLVAYGYDQNEVYRFFAPFERSVDNTDASQQQREFYAYINQNGHLINEGIVVSIPFVRELSTELAEEPQKFYRLITPWSVYLGISLGDRHGYAGLRLLGAASLKGIGMHDIAELVWLTPDQAEVSVIDDAKPLLQLLQLDRNRSAAGMAVSADGRAADLVVAQAQSAILIGEWDPLSEEVRRPVRLDDVDVERYGLSVPLTAETVESQSVAFQKLYRTLSRMETLPAFPVGALRHNQNFSGFIIGATVERL